MSDVSGQMAIYVKRQKEHQNPEGRHKIVFSIIYEDIVYSFNWLPVEHKKTRLSIGNAHSKSAAHIRLMNN